MIAFTPAFRVTEIEETGDVTVHYAEGVQGYTLAPAQVFRPQPDQDTVYLARYDEAIGDRRELRSTERQDLARWSAAQGRPLGEASMRVIRQDTWTANILFTHEEMDAFTIAYCLWIEQRLPAFDAEQAGTERAIAAGELDLD